jgi:chromosome segregation protein
MYFKSIEISGFKSFVDHTKITFDAGVTAIVGPNGCGKSNISDAIRWVLGEMRPKLLRGTKMEDFLFNGSSGRKPTGLAEVSITISEVGGMAKMPELAEFDEITVTRRLHRDGESEYLINKTPCRLKDVVDLFLDTGISTRAFSIIEQDQVQRIVTSKPEERRFIIEEAAGLMKYKHRRQEALNKLENSSVNLARVSDIIGELEKQRNSLKRQANKAERYKSLKAEMGGLLLAVSADDYRGLKASSAMLEAEAARLEEVRVSMEAGVSLRNNERAGVQNAVNDAGDEMSRLKDEEYRLGGSMERDQGGLNLCYARTQELAKGSEKLSAETDAINGSLDGLRAEAALKGEAADRITSLVGQKSGDLAKKRAELSAVQS